MDSKKVGLASLLLFVLIQPLMAMTFILEPFLKRLTWLNLDALRLSCGFLFCLATLLGWASVKTKEGRVTAILGTLMFVTLMGFSLIRTGPPEGFGPEQMQPAMQVVSSGPESPSAQSSGDASADGVEQPGDLQPQSPAPEQQEVPQAEEAPPVEEPQGSSPSGDAADSE